MKHQPFILVLISLLFLGIQGYAQEIKLISGKYKTPLEQVLATNQEQSTTAVSNENGIMDISAFNISDTLYFHHTAYLDFSIPYNKALKQKTIILISKEIKLNEIVISATKWEENIEEIPNKIEKIDSKTIAFTNPQTSADLLKNTPGIYIQKSQMGGGSPMIRGFAANSILLMFDGIRMNNSIYRSGNLQNIITVDPFLLEQSEVIFGPGSIVYGSDAMGGVIDFHSKKIILNTDNTLNFNGQAISRYTSANNEKTAHFHFSLAKKKWGSFTSFSYTNFGDQIMGNIGPSEYERHYYIERIDGIDYMIRNENTNKQIYSGYNQLNFMQKFKYQANKNLSIEYLFYYTKSSDIPRYDRLIQMSDENLKYAEWYYGPQNWMVNSISLQSKKTGKLWDAFKLQFSVQQYEESRHDRRFNDNNLNSRFENLNIFSFNADFNKKLSPDFFYFYGIEAYNDNLKSTAYTKDITNNIQSPLSTRYPDGDNSYQTLAAYSAFRYKLNRKIDISGGLRYSYVKLYSSFEDKSFFPFDYETIDLQNDAFTGSIGLVYRSEKNTRVNFNLSTGFRSPNIDDIAKVFDSEPGTVVVPNPDLKAEYVYSADLGLNQAFLDQKLSVELICFYSYLDNAMVRRDFSLDGLTTMIYDSEESDIQAITNAGFAEIYGITAQANLKLNEYLIWKAGVSRIVGIDNDGFSVRHAPPIYGNSSFNFEKDKWKFQLNTFFNGEMAFEDLPPSEADKPHLYAEDENGNPYSPAWFTIDLKSSYSFSKAFSVLFELENLMDKRYRTYSSGITAPGRSFRVSLNYQF